MQADNTQSQPLPTPRTQASPVANSRIALWPSDIVQPTPQSDQTDTRDLDQRVRESGEW